MRMRMEDGPLAGRVYMMPAGEPDYLTHDDPDGWRYFYARVPGPARHDGHGPVASFQSVFSHPLAGVCALPADGGHAGLGGLFADGQGLPSAPSDALASSLEARPPRKPAGNMIAGSEQETGAEALARLRRQGAEEWRPGGGVGAGDVPGGRLQSEPGPPGEARKEGGAP